MPGNLFAPDVMPMMKHFFYHRCKVEAAPWVWQEINENCMHINFNDFSTSTTTGPMMLNIGERQKGITVDQKGERPVLLKNRPFCILNTFR